MSHHRDILRRRIIQVIVGLPIFCLVLMFWPAGTFAWAKGWCFLGVMLSLEIPLVAYIWRKNPELVIARAESHKGTKPWDKVVLACLVPTMAAIFPIAALDDGRFRWSDMGVSAVVAGYALIAVGLAIAAAVGVVNKFAEPTVRIQTDRGHTVVDTGPYAIIRHPAYLAACFMFPGIALALGSWWALIPAGLAIVILLVRTELEDRTLQKELAGYADYTQRVRYRLVPGVW